MCGGRRRGRAARVPPRNKHRMHERGPDSAVSRWRWSLGGIGGWSRQQGVRKRGMDGWASCELSGAGRLVRLYYPREGDAGGEEARRKRGSSGLVLPASTGDGGGMGWSICRAVASAIHHATCTYIPLQRQRKEIVIGDAIVSEKDGERAQQGYCVMFLRYFAWYIWKYSHRSIITLT